MEEEAYFLFVVYGQEERQHYEGNNDVRTYYFEVKRASMQKRVREYEHHTRIRIDFDPLEREMCFVVVCRFNAQQCNVISKGLHAIAAVANSAEDAEIIKAELINNGHRHYLQPYWKFDKVEIAPVIITKT